MQAFKSANWKLLNIYRFPLFFALLIHLVFILMLAKLTPAWQDSSEDKPAKPALSSLSVSLRLSPSEIAKPEENKSEPEPEPEPELKPAPPLVAEAVNKPAPLNEKEIPQTTRANTTDEEKTPAPELQQSATLSISPDYLHSQLIQQLQKNRNLAKSARLGEFNNREIPENWTRQAISYTPGMFKSAQLPAKAIILDQWKSPDGSMQNKIKLPNGDVVCGNLAAHNPLDIYSLPIWMYRSC